jgi:hypothetical protein
MLKFLALQGAPYIYDISRQRVKRTETDLDTQPTAMQQRLKFVLKNARLPLDGCCYLNDKGNKTLFTINISPPLTKTAGMNGEDQWLSLPGHRNSQQWTSSFWDYIKALVYMSPVYYEDDLIAHIVVATATIRQQLGGNLYNCYYD